jgi:hypothetical protein
LKSDLAKHVMEDPQYLLKNPVSLTILHLLNQGTNLQGILEKFEEAALAMESHKIPIGEVNPDWYNQFFERAKLVSDEEVQRIWAKILSEEYFLPGSISVKTLNILSQLTKEVGLKFQSFCGMVINQKAVYSLSSRDELDVFGFSESDLESLRYHDLIFPWADSGWDFRDKKRLILDYSQKMGLEIEALQSDKIPILNGNWFKLTPSGIELCRVVNASPNQKYLAYLIDMLQRDNMKVKLNPTLDFSLQEELDPLIIIEALYGTSKKRFSVLEILQQMVSNDTLNIIVNDSSMGYSIEDNDKKYLEIRYSYRLDVRGKHVQEHQTLLLP